MTELNPRVLYFVRKTCTPQWELDADYAIPFYDLTFVLSGSAAYYGKESVHIVEAGQAVLLPKGCHRYAQTKGMKCVAFNFELLEPEPLLQEERCFLWNNDELLQSYFIEFEKVWLSPDPLRAIKCKGLFLLIVHRLLELAQLQAGNPHIGEIKKYLAEHYQEKITVQQVADYIGLHKVYCGSLFHQETGCTILRYVNQLRVNKAIALLEYGGAKITDVAAEIGFEDLYYFSRVFKQITGLSPENYLKKRGLA